jgi:hypothetical protein
VLAARPFDQSLVHGGPVALLMVADLTSDATAEAFRSRMVQPRTSRPTLANLRLARTLCNLVDLAIATGTPELWLLLQRIYDATVATEVRRASAVDVFERAAAWFQRARDAESANAKLAAHFEPRRAEIVRETRTSLLGLDPRFEAATDARVREAIDGVRPHPKGRGGRGNVGALHQLAELSVERGAFGDCQREGEEFEKAVKRSQTAYTNAKSRAFPKATPDT